MKTIYRISLFLNLCLVAYLIITCTEYLTRSKLAPELAKKEFKQETKTQEAAEYKNLLSAKTNMQVRSIDMITGEVTVEEKHLPIQLIGYDRQMAIAYFDDLQLHPGLKEQEKGLERIALTSFSKDQIVVSKYYKKAGLTKGFYLQAVDDYVVVYLSDLQTVYLQTDIYMPDLPLEIQNQILDKKYFKDATKLYNFLESYSS